MDNFAEIRQKKLKILSAKKFLFSWIKQMAEQEKSKLQSVLDAEKQKDTADTARRTVLVEEYKRKMNMFTDKVTKIMEKTV